MGSATADEASRLGGLKEAMISGGLAAFAFGLMLVLTGLFGLAFQLPRPDLTGYWEILEIGLVVFIPGLITMGYWAWTHGLAPSSPD